MTELFPNIPDVVREQAKSIADWALSQNKPVSAIFILKEYVESCENEEERAFLDFYFNLRMEQLLKGNEDNE